MIGRENIRHYLVLLICSGFLSVGLIGCGEEADAPPPEWVTKDKNNPSKGKKSKKSKVKLGEIVTLSIKNTRWNDHIKTHFVEAYLSNQNARKDIFGSKVLTFMDKPVLDEDADKQDPAEEVVAAAAEEPVEEVGPLQQHDVKDYRVLMVMSGTALPKAVVEDPAGNAYVIQRETRLGNKNGWVRSITQYAVLVKEEAEEPITLSIRPPIIGLQPNVPLGTDYDPIQRAPVVDRNPFEERLQTTPPLTP